MGRLRWRARDGPGALGVLRGGWPPCGQGPGGLACRWQPGRAGTETGALTANPEGGRGDTLGVGAGPASGRIRSPAIVPAGIATPNARDPHLLWAWRYQDRCPASELTQPAGGKGGLAGSRRVVARLLWDPVSEFEYLRDRMGRLYDQIAPAGTRPVAMAAGHRGRRDRGVLPSQGRTPRDHPGTRSNCRSTSTA
jgi:hypothetical protein